MENKGLNAAAERAADKIKGVLKTENAIYITELTVRFALAFILARARILDGINPFAMGFVAAAPVGTAGIVTLLGASLGYIVSGEFLWYLKYLCMGFLIYSSLYVFRNTPIIKRLWFPALCALVMSLCVGIVYVLDGGRGFGAVSNWLLESALIFATAYLYRSALSPWPTGGANFTREMLHAVSLLSLIATMVVCLAGVRIFGLISAGRILTSLLVLLVAFKGGIGPGCACGVICGFAADLSLNSAPCFSMVYTLAALTGGIFSKHGKLVCAVSFILANAAAVLWAWRVFPSAAGLYEVFIASVIFILLPGSAMARVGALFPSVTSGYGVLKAREYTRSRAELTAQVFSELSGIVELASGKENDGEDTALIFDRASEAVCRKCALASRCWRREKEKTVGMLTSLAPEMLSTGKLEIADFPEDFTEKCRNIESLVEAINGELRARVYRRQLRSRLRTSCDLLYSQYADIAAIFRDLSKELGSELQFEPTLERKLQRYLSGLDVDASAAVFRDKGGRLHAEISGSGLYRLSRDEKYLDKLSAVLGVRLCTPVERNSSTRIVLLEAEPYTVSVGIASLKKRGQSESGDRATYFKTDDGVLYVIMSDGMGSGEFAAACSSKTVSVLEKFLRAGVKPKTALHLLNSVMLLRNEGEPAFATVDLMSIDLFTGETAVYKYGSAPTYVRKGGTVKRIKSDLLAAGLNSSGSDNVQCVGMRLGVSAGAAIVSDGVLGGSDDMWLTSMLADFQGNDSRELARQIVRTASEKFGAEDDMTAITLYMDNRE